MPAFHSFRLRPGRPRAGRLRAGRLRAGRPWFLQWLPQYGIAAVLGGAGLASLLFAGGSALVAQIEPGDRGIPPISTSNDLSVGGIIVDVTGKSANDAREKGWQEAQRKGWAALFKQVNGGEGAPGLSDAALNGIVSAIVVEQEQIGPGRYVARLGVQFDRARAGQILGISGRIFHSPPLLVMPVVIEGGVPQTFETRSGWQRAWAEYRTSDSSVDYVRTAGSGADPLLLNAGQARRRNRAWWRELLDAYGAADVLVPTVRIERSWPGGPITGYFAARYGPDNILLGTFTLTAPNPAGLRAMMTEGVKRSDALYVGALLDGRLRTDPSLVVEMPVPLAAIPGPSAPRTAAPSTVIGDAAVAVPGLSVSSFAIQVDTPDADAVSRVESGLRGVSGIESAATSSVAIGGVSVIAVRYRGDAAGLRAALSAAGWRVADSGSTFRISR